MEKDSDKFCRTRPQGGSFLSGPSPQGGINKLAASAADCPAEASVRPNGHLGAGLSGCRAPTRRHRRHDQRLLFFQRLLDLVENIVLHLVTAFENQKLLSKHLTQASRCQTETFAKIYAQSSDRSGHSCVLTSDFCSLSRQPVEPEEGESAGDDRGKESGAGEVVSQLGLFRLRLALPGQLIVDLVQLV